MKKKTSKNKAIKLCSKINALLSGYPRTDFVRRVNSAGDKIVSIVEKDIPNNGAEIETHIKSLEVLLAHARSYHDYQVAKRQRHARELKEQEEMLKRMESGNGLFEAAG